MQDITVVYTCNNHFWFYYFSRISSTNYYFFNFCFLCCVFGKFLLLRIFLSYIFTRPFVLLVFRFRVTKPHWISRYICHDRCVFVVAFKSIGVCFQTEVKKIPNCKQKHCFFTTEKHTVTWLFKFFTFNYLSKLYQSFSLP